MKVAIIQFPGSNCDFDCYHFAKHTLKTEAVLHWHDQPLEQSFLDSPKTHAVILPGGFSFGDYLRCGAIAHLSPVMDSIKKFSDLGGKVIGICNGFQILVESGLLPGVLLRNQSLKFICKNVGLEVAHTESPYTHSFKTKEITLPIAHGEGNYYCDAKTLEALKKNKQILFTYTQNLNGSLESIAGICNQSGNVLGMMPHPERMPEVGKLIFSFTTSQHESVQR